MREQYRGADAVEQRDTRFAVETFYDAHVRDVFHLRGEELIEYRIPRLTRARPLRMQLRLRVQVRAGGRCEAARHRRGIRTPRLAVHLGVKTRARAAGLIDDIHRIAALQEVVAPARAAIRRTHEVGAGLPAAVPHHDGIRLRAAGRNLVLHVHLSGHDFTV